MDEERASDTGGQVCLQVGQGGQKIHWNDKNRVLF